MIKYKDKMSIRNIIDELNIGVRQLGLETGVPERRIRELLSPIGELSFEKTELLAINYIIEEHIKLKK